MSTRIMRTDEVLRAVGISRTTLWRMERRGEFPPRRRVSGSLVGWLSSEVEQWLSELPPAVEPPEPDMASIRDARRAAKYASLPDNSSVGGVYIVHATGTDFFKVGVAANLRSRFSGIQTGCPVPLRLVWFCEGATRDDEWLMHKHFDTKRRDGEWFELEESDYTYLPTTRRELRAVLGGAV